MTEIRCPNCGTRFDRESTDFCPGADCGFPVDFIEEPEPEDTAEEAILRRPGEPEEHPPEPSPPEQEPEPVEQTQALPAEPTPVEEPAAVGPPRQRRVPSWAIVAVAAVALVGLIAVVALALGDADPEVAERDAEAEEDPDVADPPDAEPDPPDAPPDNDDDPEPPPEEAVIAVQVFFVDAGAVERGEQPFVRPVERAIPHPDVDPAVAANVLIELFRGPTAAEEQANLRLVTSGATGVADLSVAEGVFRLRLTGGCDRGGLPVTIADQLIPTLKQFATVDFVKVHDPDGQTLEPDGASDSIPACLAE